MWKSLNSRKTLHGQGKLQKLTLPRVLNTEIDYMELPDTKVQETTLAKCQGCAICRAKSDMIGIRISIRSESSVASKFWSSKNLCSIMPFAWLAQG